MSPRLHVVRPPMSDSRSLAIVRELRASKRLDALIETLDADRDEFAWQAKNGTMGLQGDEAERAKDLEMLIALLRGREG